MDPRSAGTLVAVCPGESTATLTVPVCGASSCTVMNSVDWGSGSGSGVGTITVRSCFGSFRGSGWEGGRSPSSTGETTC